MDEIRHQIVVIQVTVQVVHTLYCRAWSNPGNLAKYGGSRMRFPCHVGDITENAITTIQLLPNQALPMRMILMTHNTSS